MERIEESEASLELDPPAKRLKLSHGSADKEAASPTLLPPELMQLILVHVTPASGHAPHQVCKEWNRLLQPLEFQAQWLLHGVGGGKLGQAFACVAACPDAKRRMAGIRVLRNVHLPISVAQPWATSLRRLAVAAAAAARSAAAHNHGDVGIYMNAQIQALSAVQLAEEKRKEAAAFIAKAAALAATASEDEAAVAAARIEAASTAAFAQVMEAQAVDILAAANEVGTIDPPAAQAAQAAQAAENAAPAAGQQAPGPLPPAAAPAAPADADGPIAPAIDPAPPAPNGTAPAQGPATNTEAAGNPAAAAPAGVAAPAAVQLPALAPITQAAEGGLQGPAAADPPVAPAAAAAAAGPGGGLGAVLAAAVGNAPGVAQVADEEEEDGEDDEEEGDEDDEGMEDGEGWPEVWEEGEAEDAEEAHQNDAVSEIQEDRHDALLQLVCAGVQGAARHGHVDLVHYFLNMVPSPTGATNRSFLFQAGLVAAAEGGHTIVWRALFDWSYSQHAMYAEILNRGQWGHVLAASIRGGFAMVRLCLSHNVGVRQAVQLLEAAAMQDDSELCALMAKKMTVAETTRAFLSAARSGHVAAMHAIESAWPKEDELRHTPGYEVPRMRMELLRVQDALAQGLKVAIMEQQAAAAAAIMGVTHDSMHALVARQLKRLLLVAADARPRMAMALLLVSHCQRFTTNSANLQAALTAAVTLGAEEVVEPMLVHHHARPSVEAMQAAWALGEEARARVWPLLLAKATRSKDDLLSAAARTGSLVMLKDLLIKGLVPGNSHNSDCLKAAVCWATAPPHNVYKNSVLADGSRDERAASMCKLLLAHGADARAERSAALVAASVRGMRRTCGVLQAAGADPRDVRLGQRVGQSMVEDELGRMERMTCSGIMRSDDKAELKVWLQTVRTTAARMAARLEAGDEELMQE